MTRSAAWAWLAALCLACGACSGGRAAPEQTRFYTLEYTPPAGPAERRLDCSLRVERFQVAPAYASERIVYREKAYQRQAYIYHRWRASPGDLLAYHLARDLRHSQLFAAVVGSDSPLATTHAVEGGVEEFFEEDGPQGWHAVLAISVTLTRENEPDPARRVLFQRIYRAREACAEKTPAAVVQAMSAAMARVSADATRDIYAAMISQQRR